MKAKRLIKTVSLLLMGLLLCAAVLNLPVSTRQGINYSVRTIKIPLYIKILELIDRDYHYRVLAKDITKGRKTDEEKVLAIFNWTHQNIKTNIPEGWPIVDDHILNIIIRGYGVHDQLADVFSALCVYAGIPAKMYEITPPGLRNKLVVSVVYLDGTWRIFDPFHNKYFKNKKGEIASIQDIISDSSLVNRKQNDFLFNGVEYFRYFEGLYLPNEQEYLRARQQMPLQRVAYEIKKILGITR